MGRNRDLIMQFKPYFLLILTLLSSYILVSCHSHSIISHSQEKISNSSIKETFDVQTSHKKTLPKILVSFKLKPAINHWRSKPLYTAHSEKWQVSLFQRKSAKKLSNQYNIRFIEDWPLESIDLYCVIYQMKGTGNLEELIKNLQKNPDIITAKIIQDYSLLNTPKKTKDPYLDLQFGQHKNNILALHQFSQGKNIKIGIIDTHIDQNHPELQGQVSLERSLLSQTQQASKRHGTAIASIISAKKNNGQGIMGIAPLSKIFSYAACGLKNKKESCATDAITKAINYAILDNVNIINLSLSGPKDPLIMRLIDKALEKKITIIAAYDTSRQNGGFPAAIKGVHAIHQNISPHLWFTHDEWFGAQAGGGYQFFSGSSISTACVSAITALIHEKLPKEEISNILTKLLQQNLHSFHQFHKHPILNELVKQTQNNT